jgi:hypothetical protein
VKQWEAVELEDGRIRIRIEGKGDDLFVAGPPGSGKIAAVQRLLEELGAYSENGQIRMAHAVVQVQVDTLAAKENIQSKTSSPPLFAEMFLSFLAPKNSAQAQLGDLQEMFEKNAERFGEKQARRKYWMQVAQSLAPLLWQWLKRVGFFTVLVDYFRSKLGL